MPAARHANHCKHTTLCLALAIGLGIAGLASAQSNAAGAIHGRASQGDVVVIELPARSGLDRLRLPALVWESYVGGAVLVFANVGPKEFTRLQEYLASCQTRGSRPSSV